jgi:hypothetical protein
LAVVKRHYAVHVTGSGLERLAYELSRDEVARQEKALDELRARTGTLLAASAIVASFLGSRAVAANGRAWLTILGFVAFVVSIGAAAYVIAPKPGLTFTFRGGVLLREGEGVPLNEVERRLAHWLDEYYDANQNIVERLYIGFRIATWAVLAEAMLWLLKLAL